MSSKDLSFTRTIKASVFVGTVLDVDESTKLVYSGVQVSETRV